MKFKIVTLGASAGGLAALESFFKSVSENPNSAFVIVQHLSPDFKSLMSQLLTAYTQLAINEVKTDMKIKPNNIYLIPAGCLMSIEKGRFQLRERNPEQMPINVFMTALAKDAGCRAVGIVLSGTGTDGTEGCQSIREAGGLVIAQDPESAEFSSMPANIIRKDYCHYALRPDVMWILIEYYTGDLEALAEQIGKTDIILAENKNEEFPLGYSDIFTLLKRLYQIDFSRYKFTSVNRRIERRMSQCEKKTVGEYITHIHNDREESDALYHDLLIGVTEFMRDSDAYDELAEMVIKQVLSGEDPPKEFRIWIAGCASGEEAYSMAILSDEIAREHDYKGRISVFATDTHKRCIQKGSLGIYTKDEVANLSPERLNRYFKITETGDFRIKAEIRQRVVFAQHNLLVDPPFTRIDLVTCRNLLIYLKPEAQNSVIRSLHYALKMGGALFLGSSESLGDLSYAFKTLSSPSKIYRKHSEAREQIRPNQLFTRPSFSNIKEVSTFTPTTNRNVSIERDLLQAYDLVLKRYAPDGVLITRNREVRHYFGNASHYFSAPEGRADSDFLSMLGGDLKLAVSTTLQRVFSQNHTIRSEGVSCTTRHGEEVIDVTITPYIENERDLGLFLVTFEARHEDVAVENETATRESFKLGEETHSRILMLEDELRSTKENLQATVEELQTSNEELQAINEEVQVSNEELQSTNEELHSMNEELHTVNAELEQKNNQLIDLNDDHENLLTNTEDGVLYIDKDLRIKKFNPAIAFAFNLLPQDVGRPIEHIAYNLDGQADMLDDLREVLETGVRKEREFKSHSDVTYLRRFTPFVDANEKISGVVLTFTDITEASQMRSRLARAMESARMAWWEWDIQSDRLDVHAEGDCILGYDCEGIERNSEFWFDRVHPDDIEKVRKSLDDCLKGNTVSWVCEHRYARANTDPIQWEWVYEVGYVIRRAVNGRPLEMTGTTMNIHERKLLELDILKAKDAAEKALSIKNEFLSVMSHEIRTPLNGISGMAEILNLENKDPKFKDYIKIITTCSDSLLLLIDGILDYSKAESEKMILSTSGCDIRALVEDVVIVTASAATTGKVTVKTDLKLNRKCFHLDDLRLKQVLINVVGNAIKFSQENGKVDIRARPCETNPNMIEFSVSDEGIGISPEFSEQLFQPFSQEDSSQTRKYGGTGLGLAISKKIIDLMGGSIQINSNGEKGTVVSFTILTEPNNELREDGADAIQENESSSEQKPIQEIEKSSSKVLIVDDVDFNMFVLKSLITKCGYETEAVSNMKEAVEVLKKSTPFDLAFLDIHMPNGSGYEMLNSIRSGELGEENKKMLIYAYTADVSNETKEKIAESSFDGLLEKPCSLRKIREVLDEIRTK